jgi:hypothetical protein
MTNADGVEHCVGRSSNTRSALTIRHWPGWRVATAMHLRARSFTTPTSLGRAFVPLRSSLVRLPAAWSPCAAHEVRGRPSDGRSRRAVPRGLLDDPDLAPRRAPRCRQLPKPVVAAPPRTPQARPTPPHTTQAKAIEERCVTFARSVRLVCRLARPTWAQGRLLALNALSPCLRYAYGLASSTTSRAGVPTYAMRAASGHHACAVGPPWGPPWSGQSTSAHARIRKPAPTAALT